MMAVCSSKNSFLVEPLLLLFAKLFFVMLAQK